MNPTDPTRLMDGLTVHHLRFTVRALDTILFDNQPGSALRGALYEVLRDNFCSEPNGMQTPDHATRCPVCWLLAAEDRQAGRGQNIARPLTVQPPLAQTDQLVYLRDQGWHFGFSLIGQAGEALLFLIRAVEQMGRIGVGRGRGRFQLVGVDEYNPFLDVARSLLDGRTVRRPTLAVTAAQIDTFALDMDQEQITLDCLTPLRLTAQAQLVKKPDPVVFVQRLIERCQNLTEHYGAAENLPAREEWRVASATASTAAAALTILQDETVWVEAHSGSRRQGRATPISGLVGRVCWGGDLRLLLPWLLWGQSLQVGKDAVKGNGWYRIMTNLSL